MKKSLNLIAIVVVLLVTNQLYAQLPAEGLIAHWPFNGNANDESSNNYNGDVSGATLTIDRFGNTNSAYSFDGNNDYIVVPNTPLNGLSAVTISFWMKTNAATNHDAVLWSRGTTNHWIGFAIPTSGTVKFYVANGTSSVINSTSFTVGSWVHVVATWSSGSGCILYVNNTPTSESDVLTGQIALNNDIKVGWDDYSSSRHFPGDVDDIRIYNRVLLASEINDLYNENPAPPVTNNWENNEEHIYYNSNGNVGIGTSTPDEKLTVKGKIHTEEVIVDLNIPVPDYVFEDDYPLKDIEEVENYIIKYKHLPEIPSAKEIEKEGLSMAEMNMKLLQKVEELTLYTIDLNKKLKDQGKDLDELQAIVKSQEETIKTLKRK